MSSSPTHTHTHSHNTHPGPHSTNTRASTSGGGGGGGGNNSGGGHGSGGGGSALKRLLQQRRPPSPSHRALSHDHNPPSGGNNYIGGDTRSVQSLSVVNSVVLARPASATNHQRPRLQGQGLGPAYAPGQGLARPASASALGHAASSTGGRATDKGLTLSHHDSHMLFKVNPKVKGYMGYEFPKNVKPLKKHYYNAARPPGDPPLA